MTTGLIIAGAGLAALAVTASVVQRRRDIAARRALARRHGWEFANRTSADVLDRLRSVTLTRLGHCRHVDEIYLASGGVLMCQYRFMTGFEHHRRTHCWRLVVCEVEHGGPCAVFSRFDWLVAAARNSAFREIPLSETGGSAAAEGVAVVDDPDDWVQRLAVGLGEWLARQPPERSWEFRPGLIAGHEPGSLHDRGVEELEDAARQLLRRFSAKATA